jgi:hypothetical protein
MRKMGVTHRKKPNDNHTICIVNKKSNREKKIDMIR